MFKSFERFFINFSFEIKGLLFVLLKKTKT